ncbi:MAG TPA: hypothetical protein VF652_10120 [Allosphingosinicella sp.]|jgi:hypothetical protein
MTAEQWSQAAQLVSGFGTGAAAIVATLALIAAYFQIRIGARVTREAGALTAHRDYLRLCFDHPQFSSSEQFLKHVGRTALPDLLEEREPDHVKYLWFLSVLLNTAEQIINFVASEKEWRALVKDQIRYHHGAIAMCWIEWECHYGEKLRSLVEEALADGPYPGLGVRVGEGAKG